MKEMEEMAKRDLSATSITLNTVDGEFAVQPWWWERQGVPYSPNRRVNEKWYERLGYVAYKRGIPRYPGKTVSGEDILLEAVVRSCPSHCLGSPIRWLADAPNCDAPQFMQKDL